MPDLFRVSEVLVQHIRSACPDDIAVIAYYGSFAQGTATQRSDLDIFFIPATPEGYRAGCQFIIDGIGFDFWPISWERAERMASFRESLTSVIADCKLLYVRSEADRQRFLKLRDTISELRQPFNRRKLAEQAEAELRQAYVHLYKLSRAAASESITFFRMEAHGVLTKVLQSLALLNGTYFHKGFGKNKEQLLRFPLQPVDLELRMNAVMTALDPARIVRNCEQLTEDTLALLMRMQEEHAEAPSYPDRLKGFYEEVKAVIDKLITACEMNDLDTAFFSAVHVQDEIARFLHVAETGYWPAGLALDLADQKYYATAGLPELVPLVNAGDLSLLQAAGERLGAQLEAYLLTKGVEILRFADVEEFARYYGARWVKE